MAPHWFGGYVSIFSPQGVFGFSYPAVLHLYPVDYCRCCNLERKLFMPATGARPKKTKINLMDCICLMCSGVEIRFLTYWRINITQISDSSFCFKQYELSPQPLYFKYK